MANTTQHKPMTTEKRKKMEDLIYRFFSAMDPSGTNTSFYQSKFKSMTNKEFDEFFEELFSNDKSYLILNIKDFNDKSLLKMDYIEKAAKVLGIELYEYVYTPHITMNKNLIPRTKYKVPVGYIHIKRPQQTVGKKTGISTSITKRSAITGQVTGADKNGRESDLENMFLVSLGLNNTVKELNGPRADDNVMKTEMEENITLNGYVSLADLTDSVDNKVALNTADVYLLGMGIKSDLVTKGLMNRKTLRENM